MKTILVVEDDVLTAELERDYLEAEGFEVVLCHDGMEGLRLAQTGAFDLLLLDVMLPGMSGFDICRAVRAELNVPIIMVTAKQEDVDKVCGLGLGADDYVAKPFNPSELMARVKAHIAIHERLLNEVLRTSSGETLTSGDLVVQVPQRRVTIRGKEVVLTNREFELLCFMASNPGVVFSKGALFEHVWGMDAIGDTATVTVHVNRLREKIEENPATPRYILTVRGAGYRFADDPNAGKV